MNIVALGLNHETAPVELRERLAFDADQTTAALQALKGRQADEEFVLVSTCNRVELYCISPREPEAIAGDLAGFLSEYHEVAVEDFRESLYCHVNEDAVRHLLMVASSLDSMVVGEAQIVGQVKESYRLACAAQTGGKIINRLFHAAFFTAKKVHTTTGVASGRVSVAGVAVELAGQLFADISRARVVVIGAGEMGELVVRHLLQSGSRDITVVNRSYDRGAEMAKRHEIAVRPWEEMGEQMSGADIVISSVGGQDYLWKRKDFDACVGRRRKGSLLIVDLGVPRNFEPSINDVDNVYLYSVDELSEVAEENRRAREEDISKSLEIVYEQAAEFMDWFKAKDIGPLIGEMKKEFERISHEERARFFAGLACEVSCKDSMDEMVNRLMNKLVHCVIGNVNMVAKEDGPAEAAKFVYSLVQQARQIKLDADEKGEGKQ